MHPCAADEDSGASNPRLAVYRAAVVASVLVVLAGSGVPSPLYQLYAERFSADQTAAAVTFGCYSLGVIAMLAFGPPVERRLRPRAVLFLSLVVTVCSSGGFVLADRVPEMGSFVVLDLARVGQGVATGLVNVAAGAALAALSPSGGTARATGIAGAAVPSGVALGAVVAGVSAASEFNPLTTPYVVVGGAASLVAAILAVTPRSALIRAPAQFTTPREPMDTRRGPLLSVIPLTIATWGTAGLYLALGGALADAVAPGHQGLVAGGVVLLVQGGGGLVQIVVRHAPPRLIGGFGGLALVMGAGGLIAGMATGSLWIFLIVVTLTGVGFGLGFSSSVRTAGSTAAPGELSRYFLLAYGAMSGAAVAAGAALDAVGPVMTATGLALVLGVTVALPHFGRRHI